MEIVIASKNAISASGMQAALHGFCRDSNFLIVGDLSQLMSVLKTVTPDVVLLDCDLAASVGETIIEIQYHADGTSIILLCNPEYFESTASFLRTGASACVSKECTILELGLAVQSSCCGAMWIGKNIAPDKCARESFNLVQDDIEAHGAFNLSARELQVLELLCSGLTNREIAHRMQLGFETVKTYVSRIFHKLNVNNRSKALTVAIQQGIVRSTDNESVLIVDDEFLAQC